MLTVDYASRNWEGILKGVILISPTQDLLLLLRDIQPLTSRSIAAISGEGWMHLLARLPLFLQKSISEIALRLRPFSSVGLEGGVVQGPVQRVVCNRESKVLVIIR